MVVLRQLRGPAAYEFRMQIRRRSVWLVLALLGAPTLFAVTSDITTLGRSANVLVPEWAWAVQVFLPIGFGILLADRFPRDRRLGVAELLDATPTGDGARLAGKYLGTVAATLVPILIVYALGLGWLVTVTGDAGGVARLAAPAFLLVNLPGLLFVGAFSIACPIVIPVPLYQFLFVGYWFWGNLLSPHVLPTISATWLAPIGGVAQEAFFPAVNLGRGSTWATLDGVGSVAVLLVGATAALGCGLLVVRRERARA